MQRPSVLQMEPDTTRSGGGREPDRDLDGLRRRSLEAKLLFRHRSGTRTRSATVPLAYN